MELYSILIALSISLMIVFKRKPKATSISLAVMFALIFLFSAIRYNVGTDYGHWNDVYNAIGGDFNNTTYVEWSYSLLNVFCYNVFHNYQSVIIISALFVSIIFYLLIKKTIKPEWQLYATFLFICTGIFFSSLNLVRQYIAISFIILGIILLLDDKKNLKLWQRNIIFTVFVVLASSFHTSAFIAFIILLSYNLRNLKSYKKILFFSFILSLVFIVLDFRQIIQFFSFIIPERWIHYLESPYFVNKNYSAIIKQVPLIILCIYCFIRYDHLKSEKKFPFIFSIFLLGVCMTNIFYGITVLIRFSHYFDFMTMALLPYVFQDIRTWLGEKYYKTSIALVTLYYIILTVVTIFIMNGHGVIPYQAYIPSYLIAPLVAACIFIPIKSRRRIS